MGIIQTSTPKIWASTVVPCKCELSWTISFLDKRLRQHSKLLGGFKSGRVWKLATGLSTQPLDGSQLESGLALYFWMGWNHQLLLESQNKILRESPIFIPKITSKNPQQKSPSPCESKSPMCWWSPQHRKTPPDSANGRCPWKSRGGGALLPAGTLWRRPRLGYFIWGSVE